MCLAAVQKLRAKAVSRVHWRQPGAGLGWAGWHRGPRGLDWDGLGLQLTWTREEADDDIPVHPLSNYL